MSILALGLTYVLDDQSPKAMSDKDDRTVSLTLAEGVKIAHQILTTQPEASLGCVSMPFRVVVVRHDSRFGHNGR